MLPGPIPWTAFRDVVEVDGLCVAEGRPGRLEQMLKRSPSAIAGEAEGVDREGRQYALGPKGGTTSVLTMTLGYLHPDVRDRFAFERKHAAKAPGQVELAFAETTRPPLAHATAGGDIPARGTVVLREADGAILRTTTEFRSEVSGRILRVTTDYRLDPDLALLVPAEMTGGVRDDRRRGPVAGPARTRPGRRRRGTGSRRPRATPPSAAYHSGPGERAMTRPSPKALRRPGRPRAFSAPPAPRWAWRRSERAATRDRGDGRCRGRCGDRDRRGRRRRARPRGLAAQGGRPRGRGGRVPREPAPAAERGGGLEPRRGARRARPVRRRRSRRTARRSRSRPTTGASATTSRSPTTSRPTCRARPAELRGAPRAAARRRAGDAAPRRLPAAARRAGRGRGAAAPARRRAARQPRDHLPPRHGARARGQGGRGPAARGQAGARRRLARGAVPRRLRRVHGRRLPAGRRAVRGGARRQSEAPVAALVLRPRAPLHRRRGRRREGPARGARRRPERLRVGLLPRLDPADTRAARGGAAVRGEGGAPAAAVRAGEGAPGGARRDRTRPMHRSTLSRRSSATRPPTSSCTGRTAGTSVSRRCAVARSC